MTDSTIGRWWGGSPALRALKIAGLVVLGVVGAGLFALAFGWFVMILWNWLMPAIFRLGTITYWQAFGIVVLAKILFGAVGGRGHHNRPSLKKPHAGFWHEGEKRGISEWWRLEGQEAFRRYQERMREGGEGTSEAT